MNFRFHPDALAELRHATAYYARIDPALAVDFVTHIETSIRRLAHAPLTNAVIERDVRRCLTHTFPYAILYTVEPDYILIVAVMHDRRKPGHWRDRIEPQG